MRAEKDIGAKNAPKTSSLKFQLDTDEGRNMSIVVSGKNAEFIYKKR